MSVEWVQFAQDGGGCWMAVSCKYGDESAGSDATELSYVLSLLRSV